MSVFSADDVDIKETRQEYRGYFPVWTFSYSHKLFNGGESLVLERELVQRPPAAVCILVDIAAQKVLLIEQVRIGAFESANPWLLEPVGGIVDPDESVKDAIQRECLEESRTQIKTLFPIGYYYPSAGMSNERTHLFCGLIDIPAQEEVCGEISEGENIKTKILKVDELVTYYKKGRILAAATVITVQWLLLNWDILRHERFDELIIMETDE